MTPAVDILEIASNRAYEARRGLEMINHMQTSAKAAMYRAAQTVLVTQAGIDLAAAQWVAGAIAAAQNSITPPVADLNYLTQTGGLVGFIP